MPYINDLKTKKRKIKKQISSRARQLHLREKRRKGVLPRPLKRHYVVVGNWSGKKRDWKESKARMHAIQNCKKQ